MEGHDYILCFTLWKMRQKHQILKMNESKLETNKHILSFRENSCHITYAYVI